MRIAHFEKTKWVACTVYSDRIIIHKSCGKLKEINMVSNQIYTEWQTKMMKLSNILTTTKIKWKYTAYIYRPNQEQLRSEYSGLRAKYGWESFWKHTLSALTINSILNAHPNLWATTACTQAI